VYDVADLYKSEVAIPVAFELASKGSCDIGAETRRAVRDKIADSNLIEKCIKDIRRLLLLSDEGESGDNEIDVLKLWDNKLGGIESGYSYADEDISFDDLSQYESSDSEEEL
jgi:CRISPR-associated protein Cas1